MSALQHPPFAMVSEQDSRLHGLKPNQALYIKNTNPHGAAQNFKNNNNLKMTE